MTRGRGEDHAAGALDAFQAALRGAGFAGTVGLWVGTPDGGALVTLNVDRVFPAASTIKVPLLVMALQAAQHGEQCDASRDRHTAGQAPPHPHSISWTTHNQHATTPRSGCSR